MKKIDVIPYEDTLGNDKAEEIEQIRKEFFAYPKREKDKAWQMREWRTLAVLTPEQRTKWKEMLGRPFNGPIPGQVFVSAISPAQRKESSAKDLKDEIRVLWERIDQLEKRLAEIEKNKK
jgi:hypothetical protein